MRRLFLTFIATSLLTLTLAGYADAQTSASSPPPTVATSSRPGITGPALSGPSVMAQLVWDGYGIGGRYMFPIGIPSLLSRTRFKDSWALEAGIDWIHRGEDYGAVGYHYDQIIPTFGMMWLFWINDDFAVYPKIDAGYEIGFHNTYGGCTGCSIGGVWVEGAAGLLYKLSAITLRAELGDYGLKGGVSWLF